MSAFSADLTRPDLPARKRRRRWPLVVLIVVLALLGLAVIGDRVAAAYAEHRIASEIQKEGFGARPDVTIDGFPFLTQVLSRHFPHAHMTARNVHEGPLTISRIDGSVRDVRVNSGFNAGTIASVDGTATVSFGDLAKAADQPDLELKAAGKDKVSAQVDLGFTTATATAQITKEGNQIRVRPIAVEGFPLSDLDEGDLDFTVPVTGLPMGLQFKSLTVSSKGVSLRITGSHLKFSG
jgi:LmeA-like phospholipid-binding